MNFTGPASHDFAVIVAIAIGWAVVVNAHQIFVRAAEWVQ